MTNNDPRTRRANPAAKRTLRGVCVACCVVLASCAGEKSNGGGGAAGANTGSTSSGVAQGATGLAGSFALGGDASGATAGVPDLGQGTPRPTAGSDGALADGGHAKACTDAGCTCVRIATIGHPGVYGACGRGNGGDGTGIFESWLNTQSSATVASYPDTKPTLNAAFLAQYDVIILQWLRDVSDAGGEGPLWTFSQDEVNALATWLKAGGGIISLSGFDYDGQEVAPLNALLSFTGLQYNTDGTYGGVCSGGGCWGGACALSAWNTSTPIGAHLTKVGIDSGRSISVLADAGSGAVVDCPCPNGHDCAVHEQIGNGYVFAFTDEWVTYTSQWLATSSCLAASCAGQTPADDFQVPQFWYNAISYVSQSVQCTFAINNPSIVPR